MATPDAAGASASESHEPRFIDLGDGDESQPSDTSSSTLNQQSFEEGEIVELTPQESEEPTSGPERSSLRAFGNGEAVVLTRVNQDPSISNSQSASHEQANNDLGDLGLLQLGLVELSPASSYSLTGSQLQESSLQPGYQPTHSPAENFLARSFREAAAEAFSGHLFSNINNIKHEFNLGYPNTPFPPLPEETEEWYYLKHIKGKHRFSTKIRPRHTMADEQWTAALTLFVARSEQKLKAYENDPGEGKEWWRIIVETNKRIKQQEKEKQEKKRLEQQKPQAISENISAFAEKTATAATAIANVAQSKGKRKGAKGKDEAHRAVESGQLPDEGVDSKHDSTSVVLQSAKGPRPEQSSQDPTAQEQPSKKKSSKKKKKKNKAKAQHNEDTTPKEVEDYGNSVARSAAEDPAILESKIQAPEAPTIGASQTDALVSGASSPGTVTSEIIPHNGPNAQEKPQIRPAVPLKFEFKPQRSPSASQSDKAPKEQASAEPKPDVSSFEGFKFEFQEPEDQDEEGPSKGQHISAAAPASNFIKDESGASADQTSMQQEAPSKKSQKNRKKAKARREDSRSMTEVELKKIQSLDRDQAAAVDRLKSEGSPPSIDEARGRRMSIRKDRSDSIKFLRERTLSRESSKFATLASEQNNRLEALDPGAAQNAPSLNPMANTFVPAASHDSDGWETVTKSQKRRGSKIQSPKPDVIEKQQPPRGPKSHKKQNHTNESKDTPAIATNSKGYNVKESDFPALPQKAASSSTKTLPKSHPKDPPQLAAPKKDADESRGNQSPTNLISVQTATPTAHTSRDNSMTTRESVSSSATSVGEVLSDSMGHRASHGGEVPEPLAKPNNDNEPNSELELKLPDETSNPFGQTGVTGTRGLPSDDPHDDTSALLIPKPNFLTTEVTGNKDEKAIVDKAQGGPIPSNVERDVSEDVGPEAVNELSASAGSTEVFAEEDAGNAQASVDSVNVESTHEKAESEATTEPTAPSDSLEDPSFSEPEEAPVQIPVVFNKPDYNDPRVDPDHPDHVPRDHIHFYQAYERAGYLVYRVSRLKFKCTYEACNKLIEDPVMLNTRPPRPSNNVTICNGCGPYSVTRYCCRDHAKADSPVHFISCGHNSFRGMVCDPKSIPSTFLVEMPQIVNKFGWKNIEWSRQRAFYVYCFREKAALQIDYTIFNDSHETVRQGIIVRGGTKPRLTVCFTKGDPKKDIFNRLFNIALFNNRLVRPTEMMWRLLREYLTQAGLWSDEICDELAVQFWYEFAVSAKDTCMYLHNVDLETEWEGPSGMKRLCEELEAKNWILRAWRREHPERTMWRRIAGIGFPGLIPITVHEAQQRYGPRMGWGWNGWANGGPFFSYD